jgi:hypothetical protein
MRSLLETIRTTFRYDGGMRGFGATLVFIACFAALRLIAAHETFGASLRAIGGSRLELSQATFWHLGSRTRPKLQSKTVVLLIPFALLLSLRSP